MPWAPGFQAPYSSVGSVGCIGRPLSSPIWAYRGGGEVYFTENSIALKRVRDLQALSICLSCLHQSLHAAQPSLCAQGGGLQISHSGTFGFLPTSILLSGGAKVDCGNMKGRAPSTIQPVCHFDISLNGNYYFWKNESFSGAVVVTTCVSVLQEHFSWTLWES